MNKTLDFKMIEKSQLVRASLDEYENEFERRRCEKECEKLKKIIEELKT